MTRSRTTQISTDDCTARYDSLATEYDVLRPSDGRASRNFVARVLEMMLNIKSLSKLTVRLTVSMYSLFE